MGGLGLTDELQSVICEVGFDSASVLGAGFALDQPARLEQVDYARDAAEAQSGRLGELGQPQVTVLSRRQAPEQLEPAQAESMRRPQLGVKRAGELLMGLE